MSNEQFSNASATTLSASMTSGATSLTVVDGSTWPSSPQFRILCENEIMIVTAVSGNTFTVTRGAEGTTAASHAPGAAIAHILTAGGLQNISASGATYDLIANLPAASKSGKLFIPSDTHNFYVDTGSAWQGLGAHKITPPKLANYSWLNQGSASAVDNGCGIYMTTTSTSGSYLIKALAYSAPYSIKVKLNGVSMGGNNYGIDLYNSSTGKIGAFSITGSSIYVQENSSPTVNAANPFNQAIQNGTITPSWMGFKDDGTTRHYMLSPDGLNWFDFYTEGNGTFLTPTHFGFHVSASANGGKMSMFIESVVESTP